MSKTNIAAEKASFGYLIREGSYIEFDMGRHLAFGQLVWRMEDDEDKTLLCQLRARRILSCINAFEDVPTEVLNQILEQGGVKTLLEKIK
jgi:hypothetical protein